jgi:hypothetical protein
MYGSAQQQQMMGAACRTSFDQQQQVLLPAAVGLAGNGTAMQVPAAGYNSNGISGGSCILLAPAGSNSYSQQQLQLQQPGAAMGGMFSACQPVNAGMLMNSGYGDSLPPQQQQQQVFAAGWQQGGNAPGFISADSSMVGSMAQPLLVNTQQQLQQLRLVPQMQCNAAVGSPVSGMTVGSQAQLMNWPSSAAAAAGGGVTSSPLGVSSAIGNFDMQYMQQQPASGMMLQPASMAVATDAAATGQQLQLVMQPGSQTGAASVMVGQQHAVLVPITVMASSAGTATVQQQGVQLPQQQQQQALLVPLSSSAAAATAAAASQTHMVVPQWSM